jgi:ubiquitin conjugation factor E4 B
LLLIFFYAPLLMHDSPSIDVELKAKIDAFLGERRNKNTALDIPEEDVVKMDTTTD